MVSRGFGYHRLGFFLIYPLDTDGRETLALSCGSYPQRGGASLSDALGKNPLAPRHPMSEVQRGKNLQIHDARVKTIQKVRLEADWRSEGLEDPRASAL